MKEIVERLRRLGLLFERLERLEPREFGIKKRIELFAGKETQGRRALVAVVRRKSRFLRKDAQDLESIAQKVAEGQGMRFAKKILLYEAPMCSKALALLKETGWDAAAL